ncbi:MAG TPA: hypothetical protein DCW83_12525 [Saprospirales bacterium]|jgi:hypothetical protein|nr:hypothetical protein [Saprospiraceae bacterium]HAV28762.1 hypothetical protein [Saprospirales bacterium]HAW05507.1 hypothetical protein [Saprospirales bacterium]
MKEDFKNIIKQTADNHSDDINPDIIWSGIESKLGQKKKRRFAGYWIFGGLSLVTAILFYAFVWPSEGAMDKSNFANYASETNLDKEVISDKEVRNEEAVNTILFDIESEEIDVIKDEEIILVKQKGADNKVVSEIKSQTVISKNNATSLVSSNLNKPILDLGVSAVEVGSNLVATQAVEESRQANIFNEIEGRESLFVAKVELLKFDGLDVNDRVIEIGSYEEFVFDSPNVGDESKVSFLSGVELYSGLSFGDKSVSDLDQTYAAARNDSEQLLEQWSAGMRLDVMKVMDFQLQSGVRYSMITDRMQMVNEYKDVTEYTYVKSRLIGDVIVVIDSLVVNDSIPQTFAYTTEQYNSQRLISIPLEVSFGKSFNKFDLGFGFGVDINYQLADTHVILDEKGKASVNKVGGKWISPSFSGALIAGYHLNDNWSITSRVNFRGLTLSDHESISTLKSNYKLYGLELGLKRNFGN